MARKFSEKVEATMVKIVDVKNPNNFIFLRHSTGIKFGLSNMVIGSVFLTNPGSFQLNKCIGWEDFKCHANNLSFFTGESYPDLTMRMIIQVIHESYGDTQPDGIVRIYNLSNVVQPKGELAESYHQKAKKILEEYAIGSMEQIEDPVVHCNDDFNDICDQSQFVIMGFATDVFSEKYKQLQIWSKKFMNKIVIAEDDKGRWSHPRRWQTEVSLKETAINRLKTIMSKNLANDNDGYTFLRWNGKYGRDAKFVVRDNSTKKQTFFTPGCMKEITWIRMDLANDPELSNWDEFGNEIVDDLDSVAF